MRECARESAWENPLTGNWLPPVRSPMSVPKKGLHAEPATAPREFPAIPRACGTVPYAPPVETEQKIGFAGNPGIGAEMVYLSRGNLLGTGRIS